MGFRDYNPAINRFLTRDMYNGALADMNLSISPWTGNRYTFTGATPTTFVEIDGHYADAGGIPAGVGYIPACSGYDCAIPTDSTGGGGDSSSFGVSVNYIYDEMVTNSQGTIATIIRNLTTDDRDFLFGLMDPEAFGIGGQWGLFASRAAAGYALWAEKVRPGGDWDHKPKLQETFDREGEYFYTRVPGTDEAISYDLWSNIHYGYVGTDVGIPADDLQAAADLAEAGSNDQFDRAAVQTGIDLRQQHKPSQLTMEHVWDAVLGRMSELRDARGRIHFQPYSPFDPNTLW